jgi:hypothetical protein
LGFVAKNGDVATLKGVFDVAFLLQVQETYIEEWHDCYLSESKKTGFVCTLQLANKKHRFYGLNDLDALLKEAKKRKTDVYLSLNAFEYGSRTTKALKQIRNIGVDLDCYKVNVSVPKALEEIKQLIIKGKIPNPNLVIFSGRGLQLIYSISGGAAPAMAFLTQYITTQYIAELKHLGADTAATDVTRVFRLPYSINGRNGQQVTVEIWRTLEYSLEELYSYCTPLERRRKPVKRRKGTVSILTPKRGLKTLYSLNTARKNDLELLVALRNGNIEKRNVLTYIYAYTVALILKNKQATIDFALQLNDRFQEPQKTSEVKRTAGNAYDDAMEFFEEFQKRDFRMWYSTRDGIKRPMKNETIIEELEITPEEMQQMTTLIDGNEKQKRDTERKRKKRGSVTREEYIKEQHDKTDDKLFKLQELLKQNPKATNKELAASLGVSIRRVQQLKKEL